MTTYLTPGQVFQLNEKHGWFQSGDAQSDVSKAFAQEAIEMHERVRAAAPDLLAALQDARDALADVEGDRFNVDMDAISLASSSASAAIAKATGVA